MNKTIKLLDKRIKRLQERIDENNMMIENKEGFVSYARSDNKFCERMKKELIKELTKELNKLNQPKTER